MPAPDPDPTIPPRLSQALHRLDAARPSPSPLDLSSLDAAILAAARAHTSRRTHRLRIIQTVAGLAASIALISAATWSLLPRRHTAPPSALATTTGPGSPITILDAFHLAKLLEAQHTTNAPALPTTWDATHDGRIDQQDVQAIAHQAVKLSAAPSATSSPSVGGGA